MLLGREAGPVVLEGEKKQVREWGWSLLLVVTKSLLKPD